MHPRHLPRSPVKVIIFSGDNLTNLMRILCVPFFCQLLQFMPVRKLSPLTNLLTTAIKARVQRQALICLSPTTLFGAKKGYASEVLDEKASHPSYPWNSAAFDTQSVDCFIDIISQTALTTAKDSYSSDYT